MIRNETQRAVSLFGLRTVQHICVSAALAFGVTFSAGTTVAAEDILSDQKLSLPLDAFPTLKLAKNIEERVGEALEDLNKKYLGYASCDGGTPEDFGTSVEVLSDGPEFLSFVIYAGGYCKGAAHPWHGAETVNFNLETGFRTKFMEYLPAEWIDRDKSQQFLHVLFIRFAEEFSADCANAYTYALPYDYMVVQLGLDETRHELLLQAHGLNYVDTRCNHIARVPVEWLKEAGFDRKLTEALSPSP